MKFNKKIVIIIVMVIMIPIIIPVVGYGIYIAMNPKFTYIIGIVGRTPEELAISRTLILQNLELRRDKILYETKLNGSTTILKYSSRNTKSIDYRVVNVEYLIEKLNRDGKVLQDSDKIYEGNFPDVVVPKKQLEKKIIVSDKVGV